MFPSHDQSGIDESITIIDETTYAMISDKDAQGQPDRLYYDNDYPLGNIYLYPVPSSGYSLTLYTRKPLTQLSSLSTAFNMPPGYKKALIYNLAVELAPDYEKEASDTVKKQAKKAKKVIFVSNTRNDKYLARVDQALLTRNRYDFNIYEGV